MLSAFLEIAMCQDASDLQILKFLLSNAMMRALSNSITCPYYQHNSAILDPEISSGVARQKKWGGGAIGRRAFRWGASTTTE